MKHCLSASAFLSLGLAGPLFADCAEDHVHLRWPGGTAQFTVEIADTFQERADGLMFREDLARSSGMFFVYERPQRDISFWMRNTLIPLDILFFDETGRLQSIQKNAVPLDETPLPGGDDIQYVLEINGGLSDIFGIRPGAEVQHSSLSESLAIWPCEQH